MTKFDRDVYDAVRRVPEGYVASYGQIAEMAGYPGAARAVGNALHRNPFEGDVMCHRIVTAEGKLSASFGFGGAEEQKRRLQEEGVVVINYRVDMEEFRWRG